MNRGNISDLVEEEILNSYESLYHLAFTYVHNENDAMDIVQDSVYKAIKNASKVKNEAYIKTWIWRIVINSSLDYIRKQKKVVPFEECYDAITEDYHKDFDTIDALNVLDPKEKSVIILRFFEDKKLNEIADILDVNLNTIKSMLYRSLRKLKVELMEGEGFS
ncbi:sigma-70 family RNA polymerase sigma factor [Clostridium sp. Marseille-P299]|uniref:sigma-70 family RNA polymerase sigma factor n=1 Tax=Clostridium sp. Marseille-P299 TaxID=1805477 RepID=UPI0008355AA8|nr:sigma-70 family RNA polymerase sigma factor [Clostridium sp. Marseille-P299]